jgi:D-amino peptidase
MRIYIMTDLEGVAGVLNFQEWCLTTSHYHDVAKELLTREVNAAVEGLMAGGATEIVVADGHGPGAINPLLLDPRVELMRGWPTDWPLLLDESYDAVAFVGQHAKAGTEFAHLAHTQSLEYLDLSINGVSVGELGQFAMCAAELGIPTVFASGDRALCQEARALLPGVEAVEVKRGTTPGRGDDVDTEGYWKRNLSAIHLHPERARAAIRAGAERAAGRLAAGERFGLIPLAPPCELEVHLRAEGGQPRTWARSTHPTSVAAVMNIPYNLKPEAPSDAADTEG